MSMIVQNIASLNLHDSKWISTIVRTAQNSDGDIVLELDYLLDYQDFETQRKELTFIRCWGARFQMNFRFWGEDSIFSAEEKNDSDLIRDITTARAAEVSGSAGSLRHFVIIAGLSGSQLDVVAEELRLSNSA